MQTVDLHSHSLYSDGRLRPADLIAAAQVAGVSTLALTDHDTTAGLAEARQSAQEAGLQLIPGVEISVTWRRQTIHVLGLSIDAGCQVLQDGLQRLRDKRDLRAQHMAEQLTRAGIDGALAWVQERVQGGLISRTHFAEFLVAHGYAKDIRAVFKRYLVNGKPGHVSLHWCELEEAVSWINAAGGVAAIAHPARYKLTRSKLLQLIDDFVACGGRGLEVVSSSHSEAECQRFARLSQQYDLLASCGSDFHSPDQAWAQLGRIPALPAQCTPIWSHWSDICMESKEN